MRAFLFLLIVAALAGGAYYYLTQEEETVETPTQRKFEGYPHQTTLTDSKQRSLLVNILGRTVSVVIFETLRDGKRHDFPIDQLAKKDQQFVQSLPVHEPAEPKAEDGMITLKREKIAKIRERIEDLTVERYHEGYSSLRRSAAKNTIERLQSEISALQNEIRKLEQAE